MRFEKDHYYGIIIHGFFCFSDLMSIYDAFRTRPNEQAQLDCYGLSKLTSVYS